MFRRVFIANRGEIALRVIRACKELGITSVAAFSDGDADGPWLDAADERVCIGPARAANSYLDAVGIVQAAVDAGCSALHPGYGFLAENAALAALCNQAKVSFIGPPPQIMDLLATKSPAKRAMARAGLPVVPGSDGPVDSAEHAHELAREIAYPILLKAEAGGGGRGMRQVRSGAEMDQAYDQARMEAQAAFGNDALFMEKLIERGRHIEFQVLADRWGRAVHLSERECSIQRRHQKLVEESPSPVVDDEARREMGARVAAAVAAIGYEGAGTVEFLRDRDGHFYFMEMNARLQVEHPVSELVTGVDLVEWQLRIAAGEPLTLNQEDLFPDGHAIEARINAEDPAADFRPSPGTVERFSLPTDLGPGCVRVDSHLRDGARIPPFYDSLVAKVIAHGPDRATAIQTLDRCLEAAIIEGVPTTRDLHRAILADAAFAAGDLHTGFLEERGLLP
jgi:acetyl-CoA carboxylase biotin carboxylase subunit